MTDFDQGGGLDDQDDPAEFWDKADRDYDRFKDVNGEQN